MTKRAQREWKEWERYSAIPPETQAQREERRRRDFGRGYMI